MHFILVDSHILPTPAERDEKNEYHYNAEATEQIKMQLLEKRGVTIGFQADSWRPDQTFDKEGVYISNQ